MENTERSVRQDLRRYIISLVILGSNGIVANYIDLSGPQIAMLRSGMGAIILLLIFLFSRRQFTFTRHKRAFFFLCLSGACMGIAWMFLFASYPLIGVSLGGLISYTWPVMVMMLSPLIFHERLTSVKCIGFVVVVAGVWLLNNCTMDFSGASGRGLLYAILTAVFFTGLVTFNKLAADIRGLENAVFQMLAAFLTVLLILTLRGEAHLVIGRSSLFPCLIMGLLNAGLACYLYFSSMSRLPAQTVAIWGYLEPLCAVLFSFLILHESMTPVQLIGMLLIVGGAGCSEVLSNRRQ